MSVQDVLGLLMGLGLLVVAVGYLAHVYFHPGRYRWLELRWTGKRQAASVGEIAARRRHVA
jgi:hypothetical protein